MVRMIILSTTYRNGLLGQTTTVPQINKTLMQSKSKKNI